MATLHSRTQGSRRWRKVRAHQLRIEPLCRFCKQAGKVVPAMIADHVVPWQQGKPDDVNRFWAGPFQSLCKRCHDALKKMQEHRGYHGQIGGDGLPIDPSHPFNRSRSPSTIA